jgi:DNA polymerase III alpha subunit
MSFINLKIRTEYSFKKCFGPIPEIIKSAGGAKALGIADNNSTWGHAQFHKACKKAGIKPILGVQMVVVENLDKERGQKTWGITVFARNPAGLQELYELNSESYEQFYYFPRITIHQVNSLSENVIVLLGENPPQNMRPPIHFFEFNPGFNFYNNILSKSADRNKAVVTSDVYYVKADDAIAYEMLDDRPEQKTTPQHILSETEAIALGYHMEAIENTALIVDMCDEYPLPQAEMVHSDWDKSIEEMCRDNISSRKLEWTEEYEARLRREIDLITLKKFDDYFYLVADLCDYAKKHMLVGPARGSAAGSLVCYLLYITEIDPIPHGLLFERFIDITRSDLPDIDLDFPDSKRDMVYEYLQAKYGEECVSKIGTVSRYKPKSAIGDVAKKYGIPAYETKDVKDAILERSSGDARAAFCITDTFESLDVGKDFVKKYPSMMNVGKIENHARHSGCHAAGILVCNHNIRRCCTVGRDHVSQIDKKDAEELNMLKIDALGLRTLSVLNLCMEYIGKDPKELYTLPLDDKASFELANNRRFSGIFQLEGYALQSLAKQMRIEKFDDIVAITSLARPGPLHCGGASMYVERRTGKKEIEYDHPSVAPYLKETYGIIVYQEQIMQISAAVGKMCWEDISILRKAMSKSYGDEFFGQYWVKFWAGAKENGLTEREAKTIWDNMQTFGSYGFNKSHAVAYGLLSYWCLYLKAHHPLEYALACLNNEKDPDSTVKMLRELVQEGYKFTPVDVNKSDIHWSIKDGELLGGLTGIHGCGESKARAILARRKMGLELLPGQRKLLDNAVTPFDRIFEVTDRFKDYFINPEKYGIISQPLTTIDKIDGEGTWIFIGKLMVKNLRDMNEYESLNKRGGKVITENNLFLNMTVEDDTDKIIAKIGRYQYNKLGKQIVETGKIGDFYLIKGTTQKDWRLVNITQIRKLG